MKFWDIVRGANSNLLRNKGRSFLTILAIFIGSFTIIMTTGVNNGVNTYIDKQMNSAGGEGYLEIMRASTTTSGLSGMSNEVQEYSAEDESMASLIITSKDIDKIRAVDGVESAKMWAMLQADYVTSPNTDKKFTIEVATLPSDTINLDMAAGRAVDIDSATPEIVIADKYVKPLGFSSNEDAVGKKVKIAVTNQISGEMSEVELTISGVTNPSVIGMGRSWVNDRGSHALSDRVLAGMPAEYRNQSYFAMAQLKDDWLSDEKTQQVKDDLKDMGFTAMTVEDQVGIVKTFFDAVTMILTIFGVIALLAASIGIINTLFMAVQERTREIGLMKAMGLGRGKIFAMFSWEAVMLGFWGAALGVGLAYLIKVIINPIAAETFLSGLPGFTLIEFNPVTLTVIVAIVMTIGFLAGTLPARRASKKDPIEALRYE
ncbi:FtsX-like permease family protein [Candidatus Saccharibacteria bacterium]|nr:MAG: FtsX-like permease family protein [Candidatus Saccharibacteria bacterium]